MSAHKTADGWLLRIRSDVEPSPPFVERTIGAIGQNLPAPRLPLPTPPRSESPRWNAQPHAAICEATKHEDIDSVYRRILENNPKVGEVALFGDYLTAVLLGPNLDILESSPTPIDLRLNLDDASLQRLPWEMMYGPPDTPAAGSNAPLSARPNRRFAINREVPLAPGEQSRVAPKCEFPLKILFVAGAKIDAVLRPGAEFLGLLRHLRIPADPRFEAEFVSANIKIRFLPEGDVDQLKSECRRFQPAVLHFICHGQSDPAGGASRIVLRKRPPGAREGETKSHPVTADDLADLLTEDQGRLPPIVVLNACYTATTPNQVGPIEDVHLPFAAQLVRRGAAIAVGMAGEVADPACQMFTLRFYQALLTGIPVFEAASQARRAVLSAWPSYQQSVEWSRPALFLASGLDGTVQFDGVSTFDLVTSSERFRQDGTIPRMMCDRYEILVAYDRLVRLADNPGASKLIAAFAFEDNTKGVGKTRLLEEFAVRSVMDRFLPCLLRAEGEMPRSLLDFALALSDAINNTRKNFGIPDLLETESRRCAIDALPQRPPPDKYERTISGLRSMLDQMRSVPTPVIMDVIRRDCARLRNDVGAVTGLPDHRVLILIDEFHRWDGAYGELLRNIDFTGLGTVSDPIPVVVNYIAMGSEGLDIQQKLKHLPAELRPELRRFDSELEREMVYRQLLLSEWRCAPRQARDVQANVKSFLNDLHRRTQGLPIAFLDPRVEAFVAGARYGPFLVDADYETALRSYGA